MRREWDGSGMSLRGRGGYFPFEEGTSCFELALEGEAMCSEDGERAFVGAESRYLAVTIIIRINDHKNDMEGTLPADTTSSH